MLAAGASVTGADFTITPDTVPPSAAITSIVNGSTLTALAFIQGTAADNVVVQSKINIAARDLNNGLWWAGQSQAWVSTRRAGL